MKLCEFGVTIFLESSRCNNILENVWGRIHKRFKPNLRLKLALFV